MGVAELNCGRATLTCRALLGCTSRDDGGTRSEEVAGILTKRKWNSKLVMESCCDGNRRLSLCRELERCFK